MFTPGRCADQGIALQDACGERAGEGVACANGNDYFHAAVSSTVEVSPFLGDDGGVGGAGGSGSRSRGSISCP